MSADALPGLHLPLPVLRWLPDETFYSLCCRFHMVAANMRPETTARELFGHARHGCAHDFPSALGVFVERTEGVFGATAQQIVLAHTVLPFYMPWRSPQQASDLVALLAGGQAARVKSLLGLPASRVRANHPLKACPQCMRADRECHSVAYWHLAHQLPGVWLCPLHGTPLRVSVMKATGVRRFDWILPDHGSFYAHAGPWSEAHREGLLALAQASLQTFRLGVAGAHIDHKNYVKTIRRELVTQGFVRGAQQTDLSAASKHYLQFCHRLSVQGALDLGCPTDLKQSAMHVTRMLGHSQRSTHPLRYLTTALWLYPSWEAFWHAYQDVDAASAPQPVIAVMPRDCEADTARERLLALLADDKNLSVTAAAREVGVAVKTAQIWAADAGIPIKRRSKTGSDAVRAIMVALRRGGDKHAIARRHEVSLQTVSRLLATEPGLRERWNDLRFRREQRRARRVWQKTIRQHPNAGAREIRACEPAIYAWLYRHDQVWLRETLARLPKAQPRPVARVDWEARDQGLVTLVEQTIDDLKTQSVVPLSRQSIYQAQPTIKPYLNKLQRLPRTKALLARLGPSSSPSSREDMDHASDS